MMRKFEHKIIGGPCEGLPVKMLAFDAPEETLDSPGCDRAGHSDSWKGGSYATARKLVERGDPKHAQAVRERADKIGAAFATPTRSWDATPAGAYFIPAEVLAGLPAPMRRLQTHGNSRGLVRVFIDLASSCFVSAEHVRARAIAAAACAWKLSSMRPVELHVGCMGECSQAGIMALRVRVGMGPFDPTRLAGIMGNTAWVRGNLYDWQDTHHTPANHCGIGVVSDPEMIRRALQWSTEDVILAGMRHSSEADKVIEAFAHLGKGEDE